MNLFRDDKGNWSSLRFLCALAFAVILGGWLYSVLHTGQYVELGTGDAATLVGLAGAKAGQKFLEDR